MTTLATTITATALLLLGTAARALAGPVPLDEGGTTRSGRPVSTLDDGFDWTPWAAGAVLIAVAVLVAYVIAVSVRGRNRSAHA